MPANGLMVVGNRVSFLHDGEACFAAMLAAIAGAQQEILLEMYWFASDATGRRFADALSQRAREGLHVCVSYDAVGSWETDGGLFEAMRAAGCRVMEHNPLRRWLWRLQFGLLNQRNHRKQLVVDGLIGFTGGLNLADEWESVARGGGGWRDDMVRLEGPVVADMRAIILKTFADARDAAVGHPVPTAAPIGISEVRVLANDLRRDRRAIENAYLAQIRRARASVLISNSYFIPRFAVRRALAAAVRRGVEVRVLVPGRSDVPAAGYATRRLYSWLLERGVQVHEWSAGILHTKSAVVDSQWCTVGTHNLDHRSWRYNLEINVAIANAAAASALEQRVRSDLASSKPVDLADWRYRPLIDRALELFFYRFRRFL